MLNQDQLEMAVEAAGDHVAEHLPNHPDPYGHSVHEGQRAGCPVPECAQVRRALYELRCQEAGL